MSQSLQENWEEWEGEVTETIRFKSQKELHDFIDAWSEVIRVVRPKAQPSEPAPKAQRPSFDAVFMRTAQLMAERGTCPRLKVGAVITVDNRIIATGYNGAPAGLPHCSEVGCLIVQGSCKRTTHAEANALIQCAKFGHGCAGGTLYVTHRPCVACAGLIITAGIRRVIWETAYDSDKAGEDVFRMFHQAGVEAIVGRVVHDGLEDHSTV